MSDGNGPWPSLPLRDIAAEMCLGKMLDKQKNRGTLRPYLRNVNVRWFSFDLSDLKAMRFEDGEEGHYGLESGDLVICEGGEPGRAAVWNGQAEEARIQKALHRVRFRPNEYDPFFAMYYLYFGTLTNRFSDHYTGSTIKHLTGKALSQVRFPVPAFSEQRRIVAKIEELFSDLDAGVVALQRAKVNLKRYRAAVLKAAVEGRLTEEWRKQHVEAASRRFRESKNGQTRRDAASTYESGSQLLERILNERRRKWEEAQLADYAKAGKKPPADWKQKFKEPTQPAESSLPSLPEGWCWSNLEQLKTWAMYGPRFSSDSYSDDGVLILRTTDFSESGTINLDTPPRMLLTEEQFRKYRVESGDLLITRTGSLGTLAVFTGGADAIAGAFLIHYRLEVSDTATCYIFHFLKSPSGQHSLMSGGAGIGRPNLNMPKIDGIPIPLPPLDEQQQIVAEIERRLSVIAEAEMEIEADIKRSSRLRQSILKRAFEGRLVSQDPSDEPASVLLTRLNGEGHGQPRYKKCSRRLPGTN